MQQTLILGRRRQGKSTLAGAIAVASKKTVVVFDPDGQFNAWPQLYRVQDLITYLDSGVVSCAVYRPERLDIASEWTAFADCLWEFEDYTVIIDEASMLQSANWKDDRLERFLRRAPDSVHIIQTTHRIIDVNKLARQNVTDLFCFQTGVRADLEMIRADVCEDIPDVISGLPPYHVLHYWRGNGGQHQHTVWNDPRKWDIRISRQRRAA